MNNLEFIGYTPTPNDEHMKGIAEVKYTGEIILNYKHVNTKDGTSSFFAAPTTTIKLDNSEKKYVSAFLIDSRTKEKAILDFVRESTKGVAESQALPF